MDLHGFTPVGERELAMLGVHARLYRHHATGAELLALSSDERNKSFAVGFPTLPSDDTGVAHILEHMVLAGSERFALKDPFFEMIKGSLAGFINAMTYPDRTVYPFATENRVDYLNLLDVYLDAVFRPRLSAETFAQEAWHLEPSGEDGELRLGGVVYSEMKGARADPNRALELAELGALLPDTAYAHDSGGDPRAIPDLTHDALRAFHAAHYGPGRARFVVHGDVPLEETLERIARYLEGGNDGAGPTAAPAVQSPFDAPREVTSSYPADAKGKAIATVSWALPPADRPERGMALELLEHVLVGSPAAPLRRALLDAGLGEAFLGGLSDALRQPMFRAGLRGVDPARTDEVHQVVQDTLLRLAEEGLDDADLNAARNQLVFSLRELDVHGGQRGLALAVTALGPWLHGLDPVTHLDFDTALQQLGRELPHGGASLTELMREALVDNPHRAYVRVLPDPDASSRRDEDERARLEALTGDMDASDHARVRADAEALRTHQEAPDPPEARATLPRLRRADLGPPRPELEMRSRTQDGAERVRISAPTRGLVYLDLGFDLRALPRPLLPHAGTLGRMLLETGTAQRDLTSLSRAIDRETGGIGAQLELAHGAGDGEGIARFFLRGKALAERAEALADLMVEVLREARLDDVSAIRRLALENLARRRAALEPAGHRFAIRRLGAHAGVEDRADELLGGLASLAELDAFVQRAASDEAAVREELEEVRQRLLVRDALVMGITADEASGPAATAAAERVIAGLPNGDGARPAWHLDPPDPREGWALSGQVHYLAARWELSGGAPLPGTWLAAARHLQADVLMPRLRFQGGAYGAGATLDPLRGAITTWSYRDPNLEETLSVFEEAPTRLREAADTLEETDLDALILGAVGDLDPYALPGTQGYRALRRRLRGTEAEPRRLREDLLATSRDAFRELAAAIEASGAPTLTLLGPRTGLERLEASRGLVVRDPA